MFPEECRYRRLPHGRKRTRPRDPRLSCPDGKISPKRNKSVFRTTTEVDRRTYKNKSIYSIRISHGPIRHWKSLTRETSLRSGPGTPTTLEQPNYLRSGEKLRDGDSSPVVEEGKYDDMRDPRVGHTLWDTPSKPVVLLSGSIGVSRHSFTLPRLLVPRTIPGVLKDFGYTVESRLFRSTRRP